MKFPKFFLVTVLGNFPNTILIELMVYEILKSNNTLIAVSIILLILVTATALFIYRKHVKEILILAFNIKGYKRLKKVEKTMKRDRQKLLNNKI